MILKSVRIRARGRVEPVLVRSVAEVPDTLMPLLREGDVVLTLGAGDVGGLPAMLVRRFGEGA